MVARKADDLPDVYLPVGGKVGAWHGLDGIKVGIPEGLVSHNDQAYFFTLRQADEGSFQIGVNVALPQLQPVAVEVFAGFDQITIGKVKAVMPEDAAIGLNGVAHGGELLAWGKSQDTKMLRKRALSVEYSHNRRGDARYGGKHAANKRRCAPPCRPA